MQQFTVMKHCLLILILMFLIPMNASAVEPMTALPDELIPDLENLLSFGNKDRAVNFDVDRIPAFINFLETPKELGRSFSLGNRNETVSDYFEFNIDRPWAEVVDLVYHPTIPSYLTVPSSVRRSHWIEVDGKPQPFPSLSGRIDDLDQPLIIKGIEFIENAPDTNTGAYYAYNLERTLIFFKHQNRRVLISISVQPEKSQVGKKGMVLGADDEWNYLYTGEKGCALPGLGWADTYMYSSDSIMVYYEAVSPRPQTQCAVFKWLNAGWSGMNFVRSEHIRKGVERFARDFVAVITSPKLPDTLTLAQTYEQINNLSTPDLKAKSRIYFDQLMQRYKADPDYTKLLTKLLGDKAYLESLNHQEMQSLISIEYLKFILGKSQLFDTGYFATSRAVKKPS